MAETADPDLGRLLDEAVASRALPGVVTMAANRTGRLEQSCHCLSDNADGVKMTPDALFWIASMTKAVTTVAALQLVEQGRLGLDSRAGDWVPDLADPQVLEGFDTAGRPQLRPATRPITLRHLLTHTSGFGYTFSNERLRRYVEQENIPSRATRTLASYRLPLVFDPGERWHYGIGTDWAGQVIEAVTGESLEDYFAQHILSPLGMTSTTFLPTPAQQQRLVPMQRRRPDDTLEVMRVAVPRDPEFLSGGGGLYSTPADYLRFLQMLLNDGELEGVQVLEPESVRLMQENQIGELQAGQLVSAQPGVTRDLDFFPGMPQRWSLAFLINTENARQGRTAGSLAWAGLANTYFWIDPVRQVTGLFMTQLLPFADATVIDLFKAFEADVYRRMGARA